MANKQNKKEEFIKAEKQAATIKVRTLVIAIVLVGTHLAVGIAFWNMRSDFANEVKGEVRTQMSAVQLKEQK